MKTKHKCVYTHSEAGRAEWCAKGDEEDKSTACSYNGVSVDGNLLRNNKCVASSGVFSEAGFSFNGDKY